LARKASRREGGAETTATLVKFFAEGWASGLMGYTFVFTGTKVAPAGKGTVAFVLSGVFLSIAIGAVVAAYPIMAEDKERRRLV
jgi:hypothetical protein